MKIRTTKQQKKHYGMKILLILAIGIFQIGNAQTIGTIDPTPKIPKVATLKVPNVVKTNYGISQPKTPNIYNPNLSVQQRNQMLIQQADNQIAQRKIQSRQLIQEAISEFSNSNGNVNYNFPSKENIKGTKHYRKAFKELSAMNKNNFSIKDATFIIENAYYEETANKEEFNSIVKQTGDFLLEKMVDFGYDKKSNIAKNYILFQFFSDTLQIKGKDLIHFPVKYDFDDFMGRKDWSKMFVTKLLKSNSGQCNSMPRLYLILAEQIGAEAFLAKSPHHSYIKFRDKDNNWYNIELTNNMFTANSTIIQSGFIKSEALQNEIYLKSLEKNELFAHLLTDFIQGYTYKFGYDEFVKQMLDKTLEIHPKSLGANLLLSNYLTQKFEYVMKQRNINPRNKQELQQIRNFPNEIAMLNSVKKQYRKIDNFGFEYMSDDDYIKWLLSLKKEKQQQDSKQIKETFELKMKLNLNNFKD